MPCCRGFSALTDRSDTLFSDPLRAPGAFRFDADVVAVFPDMIRRSVPGYETVIAMSGLLARRFARPGTALYDLGCSLGATTFAMRRQLGDSDCRIVAVDNSSAMIARCRELIDADASPVPVELQEADILDTALEPASMVVLNYTLQFVPSRSARPC
jgi:tRNA (cmo5U34)-methyltransferase